MKFYTVGKFNDETKKPEVAGNFIHVEHAESALLEAAHKGYWVVLTVSEVSDSDDRKVG